MPALETLDRKQNATLWPWSGVDRYGEPTRGTGVAVKVRWNWVRREVTDPQGNTITIDADVVVDRKIAVNSTMWLGKLTNWPGDLLDSEDNEVMRVAVYDETPDIKGRKIRRTVGLMRFRNDIPETS